MSQRQDGMKTIASPCDRPHFRLQPIHLRAVIGLAVLIVSVGLMLRLDLVAVAVAIGQAHVGVASLALLLNLLYLAIRGVRWWLLLRSVGGKMSIFQAARISSIGVLMSSLYPGLGETARIMLLQRNGVTFFNATVVTVEERLVDTAGIGFFFAIGLVAAPAFVSQSGILSLSVAVQGVSIGLIILVILTGIVLFSPTGSIEARYWRWVASVRRIVVVFTQRLQASAVTLMRVPGLALSILVTTIVSHLLAILVGWLTALAFGLSVPLAIITLMVVTLSLGIGLVPSPLGIGVYQATGLAMLGGYCPNPEYTIAVATALQAINYGAAVLAALAAVMFGVHPRSVSRLV
jgi:uncharacterized membrane protein YbhN (UPF0104 family)